MKFARLAAHTAALITVGGMSASAWAGSIDDPICADRPGKGSSPCAAPKDHWQLESGLFDYSVTKGGGSRSTSLSLFDEALKYGLTDSMHVEVEFTAFERDTDRTPTTHSRFSGIGDTNLKVKQELTAKGADFSAALYPYVKIPTANHHIGNGHVEGGVVVPLGLSFGKSPWSLSASPEVDALLDSDGHGYHPQMVQTLSLNLQATKALSLSAELWGQWDFDTQTNRQYSIDPSIAYQLNKNVQIDGGVNFGLNRNTPDIEWSGGVSVRF